jgi:2-polyprenyl-6-methoxyphenol hydroxylase-like FAD-dependent oxidoreductase
VQSRRVAVLGAGVAGLSAALLLARDGHQVILLERDELLVDSPAESVRWQRRGIPHFLQPHAFIPRGRVELRENLPDVYTALLTAGASEVDLRRKLPGPVRPADAELQYLAVRRPLLEWALRSAVSADPRIDVRAGTQVSGVQIEHGRATAIQVGGTSITVDVVVDALGRRTPTTKWLAAAGIEVQPMQSNDCGVVYYSRYYGVRPGFELPDGPWFLSPRGDLGYFGFSSFPGDNRTFAAVLAVPTGFPEWRELKDAAAFEAAVATIPALRRWVDPDGVDPITDVLPMAGLRNTLRSFDAAHPRGLVPAGDAFSHTDPVLAHGLSFAIMHAAALAATLREHDDVDDALSAYAARTRAEQVERYELATALDEQRHRMWAGLPVDLAHRDGDYALFTMIAAGAAATVDPDVFRAFIRRIGLLDSTTVLDSDVALQGRIEGLFGEVSALPRPPTGPTREDMLAIVRTPTGAA